MTGMAQAARGIPRRKSATLKFGPWSGGLRTDKPGEYIARNELSEARNIILQDNGVARTRPGCLRVNEIPALPDAVTRIFNLRLGAAWYLFLACADGNLYYRTETDPAGEVSVLMTHNGYPTLIAFADRIVILDAAPLRQWRGPGYGIEMLYDDGAGAGPESYFYAHRWDAPTGASPLMAVESPVTQNFTTPSWPVEFGMIPPTRVFVTLSLVGSLPGAVNVLIKEHVGGLTIASGTIPIEGLTETPSERYALMTVVAGKGFEPETAYRVEIFYVGDADNYVQVHHGAAGMVGGVCPGLPPSGLYACVQNMRLWVIQGAEAPQYPDRVWYSAANNPLDWSSSDGGGWLSCGRDVGAVAGFYNAVWLFGTDRTPHLSRITGDVPSQFVISESVSNVAASQASVVACPQDVWFFHRNGVDSVRTMEAYGDVRAESQTGRVKDISTAPGILRWAFAAYQPDVGAYCLKIVGDSRLYAVHTQSKTAEARGDQTVPVAPTCRWDLAIGAEISALCTTDQGLLVGAADGTVWLVTDDAVLDEDERPVVEIASNRSTTRFGELCATAYNFEAFKLSGGGSFDVEFWTDHDRGKALFIDHVEIPDGPTYQSFRDRRPLNFNFRSLQVRVTNVDGGSDHFFIGEIHVFCESVGGM